MKLEKELIRRIYHFEKNVLPTIYEWIATRKQPLRIFLNLGMRLLGFTGLIFCLPFILISKPWFRISLYVFLAFYTKFIFEPAQIDWQQAYSRAKNWAGIGFVLGFMSNAPYFLLWALSNSSNFLVAVIGTGVFETQSANKSEYKKWEPWIILLLLPIIGGVLGAITILLSAFRLPNVLVVIAFICLDLIATAILRKNRKEKKTSETSSSNLLPQIDSVFSCPECGLTFKTEDTLNTHTLNWHENQLIDEGQDASFLCALCSASNPQQRRDFSFSIEESTNISRQQVGVSTYTYHDVHVCNACASKLDLGINLENIGLALAISFFVLGFIFSIVQSLNDLRVWLILLLLIVVVLSVITNVMSRSHKSKIEIWIKKYETQLKYRATTYPAAEVSTKVKVQTSGGEEAQKYGVQVIKCSSCGAINSMSFHKCINCSKSISNEKPIANPYL